MIYSCLDNQLIPCDMKMVSKRVSSHPPEAADTGLLMRFHNLIENPSRQGQLGKLVIKQLTLMNIARECAPRDTDGPRWEIT